MAGGAGAWFTTTQWSVVLAAGGGEDAEARERLCQTYWYPFALDSLEAERRYALEPVDRLSADRLYDRRWALLLLERVLTQLEREQEEAGRAAAYQVLKEALTRRGGESGLAELGRRLNLSEGAVKVAVHRLRRRYRELLDREIAATVGSGDRIEEERRELLAALAS